MCRGKTGNLMANPTMVKRNNIPAGRINSAPAIFSGRIVISKVLVEKYNANIPTSMKALPNRVYIRNFIAEYSFLPLPHTDIRKNIGINSNSQKMKNKKKSIAVNTPITAP